MTANYLWFEQYDHAGSSKIRLVFRTLSTEHLIGIVTKENGQIDVLSTLMCVDSYLGANFSWLSNAEYHKLLFQIEQKLYNLHERKEVPRYIQKAKKLKAGDRMPVTSWHW